MGFQAVPNTAEIVIKYNLNLKPMFNVMHAEKLGGYDLIDLQQLANGIDFAVAANWLPQQTDNAVYQETVVRGLNVENDQEALANANAGNGSDVSPALPGNVTLSIKKGSGFTGRSARGRLYWIGMPRDNLSTNENIVTALDTAAIVAAVEGVRVAIGAALWVAVIVSRFSGGVKRPTGITFPWTTTSSVDSDVDSSRRRLN